MCQGVPTHVPAPPRLSCVQPHFNQASHCPPVPCRHPWSSKREQLFGRFSAYKRIIARNAPSLLKKAEEDVQGASGEGGRAGQGRQGKAASSRDSGGGSGGGSSGKSGSSSSGGSGGSGGRVGVGERPRQFEGSSLCWVADQDLLFCDARLHFMEWAAKQVRRKVGRSWLEVAGTERGTNGTGLAGLKGQQRCGYRFWLGPRFPYVLLTWLPGGCSILSPSSRPSPSYLCPAPHAQQPLMHSLTSPTPA